MATRKLKPSYPFEGSPADVVIKAFGGVTACADAIERNKSSVSRWRKALGEGGTGGHIPSLVQQAVLREAKARGIKLTAADLIPS
jgi:hypothetical protein